ncbi:MAG: glycoside hydrolase family 13 protein [Prevotella sp.]|nr:glycoside hydrolase family 13 protein [Prevotella sp.]
MKKLIISLSLLASLAATAAKPSSPQINSVEPPYWWTGMANDTLQIMLSGPRIGLTETSMKPYEGVSLIESVRLDSPNYLLLYLTVSDTAKPGVLDFTFSDGKKKAALRYELKERSKAVKAQGFDASDVLYLIMPDRFARAGATTDAEASRGLEYAVEVDRADLNARHGGNIAGMEQHLGYIDSLGVTAIWVNPVLENDMPGGSYHGYATTDYYRIDPRFGTNGQWRDFVGKAHDRGIKVVMDMIFNHSGSNHPWMKDMPSRDWYNFPDSAVTTNFRLSTLHDPYVSDYDKKRTVDGWFVTAMPDLNQRNPHLRRYLSQNSIWWIEDSGIDGIRMDTYPYADERAMASWIDDVMSEYPGFNIVGECWYGNEGGEAYWQRGSKVNPNGDPRLPTVMDFVLSIKARDAFKGQTDRLEGLNTIYDHLALDYLFPDPTHILTFLDNHDTDRFLLEEPDDLGWWKQAVTFLLTSRGIPQIYYGTELLMNGTRAAGGDGNVRRDMPGGFPGDKTDAFTAAGRTDKQNEAFDFIQKLLQWRRGNEAIARGSLKHFMPENGLYVYQRRSGDKEVTVILNGNDSPVTTTMERTLEILPYGSQRRDMLTGETITISPEMTFSPRQILILEN